MILEEEYLLLIFLESLLQISSFLLVQMPHPEVIEKDTLQKSSPEYLSIDSLLDFNCITRKEDATNNPDQKMSPLPG